MPNVVINNLCVSYYKKKNEQIEAIKNFNATFLESETSVILGESGCGKSTLLKTLSGLLDYEGDINVDGVDYSSVGYDKRSFAYVSQDIVLYPILTIYDNLAFPLSKKKYTRGEIDNKIKSLAKEFDIYQCLSRLPKQLSKGQCQRAAIIKALIKDPKLILFDEPLSGLDTPIKKDILHLLKQYFLNHHSTVIFVTHDLNEALQIADKIFIMKDGEIVDQGTVKQLLSSTNIETKLLFQKGLMNETEN